jgi:hypothetical protein
VAIGSENFDKRVAFYAAVLAREPDEQTRDIHVAFRLPRLRLAVLKPRAGHSAFGAAGVCCRRRGPPLEPPPADAGPTLAKIAKKHALAEADLGKLASAWHTDMDLGREIEVVTDMTKSRLAGFHEYQPTLGSFLTCSPGYGESGSSRRDAS